MKTENRYCQIACSIRGKPVFDTNAAMGSSRLVISLRLAGHMR